MNVELKPCPFCGSEAEMMGDQYPYVECQECAAGFTADHSYEFDEGDAASKWNARSAAGDSARAQAGNGGAVVPEGWSAKELSDHGVRGYQVSTPRISGVKSHTSVWEDSDNPAEQMLYLMLTAAPTAPAVQPVEQHPDDAARDEVERLRARVNKYESDTLECCAEILEAEARAIGGSGLGKKMTKIRLQCLAQRLRQQADEADQAGGSQ